MNRNRPPRGTWYESDNPSRHAWGFFRTGMGMTILAVLALALCGGIGWGIKVLASDVKGAGDATIKINSGDNRIQSQELFEQLYAAVLKHDKNLDVMAEAVRLDPSSFNKTNYTGTKAACNNAVEDYNAEARKISSEKWKADDLPHQIDTTAPETDCKENAR